ncbi:hypothetical protein SHIRM173S_01897 [Streptomyces hirsutus]
MTPGAARRRQRSHRVHDQRMHSQKPPPPRSGIPAGTQYVVIAGGSGEAGWPGAARGPLLLPSDRGQGSAMTSIPGSADTGPRAPSRSVLLSGLDAHPPGEDRRSMLATPALLAETAGRSNVSGMPRTPRRAPTETGRSDQPEIDRSRRSCRSGALCGRLQDRHALHVVRHRKHVTLDASGKTAGQRCFWGPSEGRRAPGASNERHGPTSVRHRRSGASRLPAQHLPRYGASRRWRRVGAHERPAVEGAV